MRRGKASEEEDGVWRAKHSSWLWARFRLAMSRIEMCVRRVQMMQRWVRAPHEDRQAIAAVWADTILDQMSGKARPSDGEEHAASTP